MRSEAEQLDRAVVAADEALNTRIMIAAAAVMILGRRGKPVGDSGCVVTGAVVLLALSREEDALVVHRETEHPCASMMAVI